MVDRATGRHFPHLDWKALGKVFAEAADAWMEDNAPRMGASLAFYTLLSMVPLLVVIIAVAAFFYGREAAQGQLFWHIRDLVGTQGAAAIQESIQSAYKTGKGAIATPISGFIMLFGASTVVLELQDALNTIWHVPPPKSVSRLHRALSMVKERFYSFGLILGAGVLLLASLLVNAGIAVAGKLIEARWPTSELWLHLESSLVSLIVVTFLFAAIYKVMPAVHLKWSDVLIGAGFTSLLFTVGKQLIALYLGKITVGSPFGTAGSIVMVLVWVYYSAQVFFMGAEFTKIYAIRHGSQQYRAATVSKSSG